MNVAFHISWWAIPAAITALSLLWAFFWPVDDGGGMLSGIGRIFMLVPALFISLLAWVIAGVLK